jgi:hypothetical protein
MKQSVYCRGCQEDTVQEQGDLSDSKAFGVCSGLFALERADIMQQLIGLKASSRQLWDTVNTASEQIDDHNRTIKVYSDCVYYNYHRMGMSLMFKPTFGFKLSANAAETSLDLDKLILDGIDVFNAIDDTDSNPRKTANKAYRPFPRLPIEVHLSPLSPSPPTVATSGAPKPPPTPSTFFLETSTTGKDLVSVLGEPTRKGGGGGPSSGSIAIWCDWSHHGVMVEFGGPDSTGPKAWESGKDARWAILSLYTPDSK